MRWYDLDRLDNRDPAALRIVVDRIAPKLDAYFKPTYIGFERIPEGAGVFVANHNMGPLTLDTFMVCSAIGRAHGVEAIPYGMAHDKVFNLPGLNQMVGPIGAVRGCQENGARLLRAAKKLLVYPGGASDAMRPFRDRYRIRFSTSRGYIRLAIREGAPVIPVVTAGAHSTFFVIDDLPWLARGLGLRKLLNLKVWPLCFSIPWGFTIGPPPPFIPLPARISIEVMNPIHFDRSGEEAANDDAYVDACKAQVETQMQATMDRLANTSGFRSRRVLPEAYRGTPNPVRRFANAVRDLAHDTVTAVNDVADRWSGVPVQA